MTSRNYDLILSLSTAATAFRAGNNIIGNSTLTTGMVVAVDYATNKLKVKLNNLQQEFSATEKIHSNTIVTTGTANGSLNTLSLPFQSNTMISNVTTAYGTISAIAPSTFIAEKNAFTQNPVVRLYSIYYPGEWYPPNANGNPTGEGTGYAWPNDFPLRLAEIIGDIAEDISYNVTYGNTSYLSFPVSVSGLDQGSDGKINELSLTVFNADNIISALVEDPYLLGRATTNSVYATVNGEVVFGIDPNTVVGSASYVQDVVNYYGRANASFDKYRADATGSGWTRLKMDTRDLLGATVEIKTTFANFLDYWPEYSKITNVSFNVVTLLNSSVYRVGDTVRLQDNNYSTAIVEAIDIDQNLYLSKPITKYLSLASRDNVMEAITFKPDGTKMYVAGRSNDRVYEYNLSKSWDIGSASYLQQFSITAAAEQEVRAVQFKPDGTSMYIVGTSQDNIVRYTLSTPWNVTTASLTSRFNIANLELNTHGLVFDNYGANAYIVGQSSDKVFQLRLPTPWDITTAVYLQNTSIIAQDGGSTDIFFKSDGSRLYMTGLTNDKIHQYDLTIPWDITTLSYDGNTSVAIFDDNINYVALSNDGSNVYFGGSTLDNVHQVPLSVSWDITTINYNLPDTPLYIANPQADSASYLVDTYKIDQLEGLSEYVATFGLVSWLQYFKIVTPKRKYYKNTCQWRYRGEECQYPGPSLGGAARVIPGTSPVKYAADTPIAANNMIMPITGNSVIDNAADVCAKSLAACTLRNNSQHYGGFPGVGRTVPQM